MRYFTIFIQCTFSQTHAFGVQAQLFFALLLVKSRCSADDRYYCHANDIQQLGNLILVEEELYVLRDVVEPQHS